MSSARGFVPFLRPRGDFDSCRLLALPLAALFLLLLTPPAPAQTSARVSVSVSPESRLGPLRDGAALVTPGPVRYRYEATNARSADELRVEVLPAGDKSGSPDGERQTVAPVTGDSVNGSAQFSVGDEGGEFRLKGFLEKSDGSVVAKSQPVTVRAIPCTILLPGVIEAKGTCTEEDLDLLPPGPAPELPQAFPDLPGSSQGGPPTAVQTSGFPQCDRRGLPLSLRTAFNQTFPAAIRDCYFVGGDPPPGTTPKGLIMIIASGGWISSPKHTEIVVNQTGIDDRWEQLGYLTLVIEHTQGGVGSPPGSTGYENVIEFFDLWRSLFTQDSRYGDDFPICYWGGSSAGNFALMGAATRANLDCAITEGAPTNLPQLPQVTRQLAVDAFGAGNLGIWSPINYSQAPPMLLGHLYIDPIVPYSQSSSFANARANADLQRVSSPSGFDPRCSSLPFCFFTHAGQANPFGVGSSSFAAWRSAEQVFAPEDPDS